MMNDQARAAYHLNRHRGARRPAAEPQTDMVPFECEPQARRLVPLGHKDNDEALFAEPKARVRHLVPVEGWPDYREGVATMLPEKEGGGWGARLSARTTNTSTEQLTARRMPERRSHGKRRPT